MYNKLFTKILDSSIWLESTPTRLLWMVFIAAMDEDGFCAFASMANLSHRARLSLDETAAGVEALEAPDQNSSDPENEGRRIERVQGGWIVLNAKKYRELVTREAIREQTRIRVARYRKKRSGNADVTTGNEKVTPSEAEAEASNHSTVASLKDQCLSIYSVYPRKEAKPEALKAIRKALQQIEYGKLMRATMRYAKAREGQPKRFTPMPSTWFNQERYNDDPSSWTPDEPAEIEPFIPDRTDEMLDPPPGESNLDKLKAMMAAISDQS